ncbi:ethanolamine ammonia-lyase reactivating factor EutA [Haloprofundus sp. MHR1]|uniref:ethanolamine ammonia-lyase reactivating factor EutA n=1 Tax=Haloprofundus sp. MHR1 TaxID=2572921 RepID=UPI0010BE2324|nr:ethanolamine ammonia-lyase reactivating factor EutA [Haloprofundus sp. MHR1]QCJ45858.1 ethanolamine ammonia lyase-activating protein [Haloprofundus sp. MHR1]
MTENSPPTLTSVGIDIGTTTTQVIVSELTVNRSGIGAVTVDIGETELVYRGAIHETPLLDRQTLDTDAVRGLVESELDAAGYPASTIDSGAVIVTGESSYKENAEELVTHIATRTGEFVVAAAGPELEAVLAGKGSGAAAWATESQETVLNVDVGGGTTNMCLFSGDDIVETRCLDAGGRLLRFDESGHVTHISEPARRLVDIHDLDIDVSTQPTDAELRRLAAAMADLIFDTIEGPPLTSVTDSFTIGTSGYSEKTVDTVVFSGGVGRLISTIEKADECSPFAFDDFGVVLASAIRRELDRRSLQVRQADEDIRATVVGVGTQTASFSGTTTHIDESVLPLRNLPVVEGPAITENQDPNLLVSELQRCFERGCELYESDETSPFVLSLPSITPLDYERIKALAQTLDEVYKQYFTSGFPRIVLTRQNCAKALGQQLRSASNTTAPLIVVDEIVASDGDYLDIGDPLEGGQTVPVVVKSLVFGS